MARTGTNDWLVYADNFEFSEIQEILPGTSFQGSGTHYGWPAGMFGEKSFAGLQSMGIHTASQLFRVVDALYKPADYSYSRTFINDTAHERFVRDFRAFHINRPAGVHGFLLRFIDPIHYPEDRAEYERRLAAIGYPLSSKKRVWDPARAYPFFVNPYSPAFPDSVPKDIGQSGVLGIIAQFFQKNSIPEVFGFAVVLALASLLAAGISGDGVLSRVLLSFAWGCTPSNSTPPTAPALAVASALLPTQSLPRFLQHSSPKTERWD